MNEYLSGGQHNALNKNKDPYKLSYNTERTIKYYEYTQDTILNGLIEYY